MRPRPCRRLALALALLASACAPRPETFPILEPVGYDALPGWAEGAQGEALPALERSCAATAAGPGWADRLPPGFGAPADWRRACAAADALPAGDDAAARAFLERWFRPFRVVGPDGPEGLFTGYFEPELSGSLERRPPFVVPLYGRPADLVTVDLGAFRDDLAHERIAGRVVDGRLTPYYTRAEIEAGAVDAHAPTLAWVEDPVEAFFLQVQGSGRVRLPDGRILRLGYAAQNGQPYTSIGRLLVERGALPLEAVSLQSIRDWLHAHPDEGRTILEANASYVFFRVVPGDGPTGTLGVALTPGRSVAVDPRYLPLGPPLWIDTADPLQPEALLPRLVVAQDTGGAIRGAVRADLFWGSGAEAEARAGRMRSSGRYYVLVPRPQIVSVTK